VISWLVGVKRLVQEVRNVEAPLSPSSDCHNDVKPMSVGDVQPSSVAADCSTLIAAGCQSDDAPLTLLDVSGNTDVSPADAAAVNTDTHATVASSLGAQNLSSETFCTTFASRENVEDSAGDKKPVGCAGDTLSSSYDVADVSPAHETHVGSDDTVTPADSVTVDS